MNGIYRKMLKWTLLIYGIATFLVFVPLFNWMYITNHSYPKWVGRGVFQATARAIAWPVFIRDLQENPVARVKFAFESVSQAIEGLPSDPRQFTHEDYNKLSLYFDKALALAEQVDCDYLNQCYPEMGDHFRQQFVKGLQLSRDGISSQNIVSLCNGYLRLQQFSEWFTANANAISESV